MSVKFIIMQPKGRYIVSSRGWQYWPDRNEKCTYSRQTLIFTLLPTPIISFNIHIPTFHAFFWSAMVKSFSSVMIGWESWRRGKNFLKLLYVVRYNQLSSILQLHLLLKLVSHVKSHQEDWVSLGIQSLIYTSCAMSDVNYSVTAVRESDMMAIISFMPFTETTAELTKRLGLQPNTSYMIIVSSVIINGSCMSQQ